jgi:uncharacterized protein (TIGR03663 family)
MKHHRIQFFSFILIGLAAAGLRFWNLDRRPMHTDEAVHALKFGDLLEKGEYRFDPDEYHGPTLNYFTLIPAFLRGERTLASADETTLRIVPAVFGTGLLLLLLLVVTGMGWNAVSWSALFTAVSPAMVFYSRYYIQEMLFVCFTFGMAAAGYRWLRRPAYPWAVLCGIFAGLMHATKETCIIPWGAMAAALAIVSIHSRSRLPARPVLPKLHLAAGFISAALVSVLFMSSFFTHLRGIPDSILTYRTYFTRASVNPVHVHSWTYYFHLLGFWKAAGGPVWSEALIPALSVFGIVAAFGRKRHPERGAGFIRFIAVYSVLMTVVYSLIPYKTPWNLLGFFHGWILLAGVGVAFLFETIRKRPWKYVLFLILSAGSLHLAGQSRLAIGPYDCDPLNPYVYSHPGRDVLEISKAVHRAAGASAEGLSLPVEIVFPDHGYWPLPWYFRDLPNTGWYDRVEAESPAAPLILSAPVEEKDLVRRLYELPPPGQRPLYVPLFERTMELRPGAGIDGYVRMDLRDRMGEQALHSPHSEERP